MTAPPHDAGDACATGFLRESARFLVDVHLPRLQRAAARLPEDDLWWRPHAEALSVGTILLHLEGNVRQWILSGLGDVPDQRDRDAEFAAVDGPRAEELLARLEETVRAAAEVLGGLDADRLAGRGTFQGREQDVLYAVYHVVEHFAYHTGQATWIAKARAGATG
jgi:uncharacterized damage-inducible protein DinB